jgi:sec-independent protein translocase protein TatC
MFWIGVTFEFPMIIFVIARIGWIRAGTLAKYWRFAIILIAVIAALVTPTVDPVNMAIVMGPLIILYFFSIGLAFIAQKGLKKT